jgi:anaerobic ribonucleoside-triphosphate reductase activating protein
MKQENSTLQQKSDFQFNVAAINLCTESEGPYKRLAVWFQGCDKRCLGCCNKELFSFTPAHILPLNNLLSLIIDAKKRFSIEGITYLGGEPVLQQGLAELSRHLRDTGLGVILFTGRLFEELPDTLIQAVDMIVDGGFEENNIDNARNMIGSKNQTVHFVTTRYISCKKWFYTPRPKHVEINFSDTLIINGDVVF